MNALVDCQRCVGELCAMKYLAVVLFAALTACSSPTGSTCPADNPPTYASFGQQFMQTYCLDCHSMNSTNRHGAPKDQNYDSEAQIKAHADEIDAEAAAGPDATNTDMPRLDGMNHMAPSVDERKLLGQYLACLNAQ